MTLPRAPSTKRRIRVAILIGAGAVLLIAVGTGVLFLVSGGQAATPTPVPTSTPGNIDPVAIQQLDERLRSGDPEQVGLALAILPNELDATTVEGFAASEIRYELSAAEPFEGGWFVPAAVTDAAGQTTRWTAAMVETENGLVLLDSVKAQQ